MGALLRGKMLAVLRALHRCGAFARVSDFDDPEGFDRLMLKLASAKRWIVYAKRPFARVDHVLEYLGRFGAPWAPWWRPLGWGRRDRGCR